MTEQEAIEKLKSGEELPEVKSVEGLRLAPGDFVVLTFKGYVTKESGARLIQRLEGIFEGRNKVLILEDDVTIRVLKSDA
jgi:hypothetical protein